MKNLERADAERFKRVLGEERQGEQVEQDLLISRAVVAIYSDPCLAERLAWRGGTALCKPITGKSAMGAG